MNWAYPATMLAAIIISGLMLKRTQQRLPMSAQQKFGLGLAAFAGSMIASKIPFLFEDWSQLSNGPIWLANGKTIMFGIVGGYLGVEAAKKLLKVRTKTGDSFAVPVAIAISIGRIACFFGGCCFGKPTNLPWGVHFATADGSSEVFRHPTQIYESIFHLAMAGILFLMYRQLYLKDNVRISWLDQIFRTHLFKFYLLAYMAYRLVSEELRPETEYLLGLTLYQWGAIAVIPVFTWLWFGNLANGPRNRQPDSA